MITERERAALAFIVAYQRDSGGVSPRLEDIGAAIGERSKGRTIFNLVRGLELRGFIRRLPRRARSIEVLATDVALFKFDASEKELVAMRPS